MTCPGLSSRAWSELSGPDHQPRVHPSLALAQAVESESVTGRRHPSLKPQQSNLREVYIPLHIHQNRSNFSRFKGSYSVETSWEAR